MFRPFLSLAVCALWFASLASSGWMRAECVRACFTRTVVQADTRHAKESSCCAKRHHAKSDAKVAAKSGNCTTSDCPKCKALADAQLAMIQMADAPLFFDATCGAVQPVVLHSSAPLFAPSRTWQWSLPPPGGTLLDLHCQLLI